MHKLRCNLSSSLPPPDKWENVWSTYTFTTDFRIAAKRRHGVDFTNTTKVWKSNVKFLPQHQWVHVFKQANRISIEKNKTAGNLWRCVKTPVCVTSSCAHWCAGEPPAARPLSAASGNLVTIAALPGPAGRRKGRCEKFPLLETPEEIQSWFHNEGEVSAGRPARTAQPLHIMWLGELWYKYIQNNRPFIGVRLNSKVRTDKVYTTLT